MRFPYLSWMPNTYNNNFPGTNLSQSKNAVLNFLERKANRDSLRSLPLVLTAEVTKRCNLNCVMCLRDQVEAVDMLPEVMAKLKAISPAIGEIQLFGYGEPLSSKPFYSLLSQLDCARLTFTTNGTLLAPGNLRRILTRSRPPVHCIYFSIDGATPETYQRIRKGSNFARVVRNLAYVAAYRRDNGLRLPRTVILFLAMKSNIRELPDVVRLAHECGVSGVQVAHLIVWDEANRNESLLYHPEETRHYFAKAEDVAVKCRVSLDLPALISLDEDRDRTRPARAAPKCYWPWRHPVLKFNGDVQPCCAAPDVIMGNILEEPFLSIWNGRRFCQFRQRVNSPRPPEVCRTCDIRFRNLPKLEGIEHVYVRPPPKHR